MMADSSCANGSHPPATNRLQTLPLETIQPQPDGLARLDPADPTLAALARSMNQDGLLCPILVTPVDDGYRLVAGARRLAAAKLNGWLEILARILPSPDTIADRRTIAENLCRKQLSPLEEATAVAKLCQDNDNRIDQVAALIDHSEHWVQSRLDLLRFPPDVLQAVHDRKISLAAAKHLAAIADDDHRTTLVHIASQHGATATVTAGWLRDWLSLSMTEQTPSEFSNPAARPVIPPPTPENCHLCHSPVQPASVSVLRFCPACARALLDQTLPPSHPQESPPV